MRYTAPKLRAILNAQGRRQDWLAAQVGISGALLNRAMGETRTIDEATALRIAAVLGVPFFVAFDFPKGESKQPIGVTLEEAA